MARPGSKNRTHNNSNPPREEEEDNDDDDDDSTEEEMEGERNSRTTTGADGAATMKLAGMGSNQSLKEVERMMVKKTVSKSTMLYCPFVNNARELAHGQPFAKITMGFLGKKQLTKEKKIEFWEEYKHTAHKALNVKRSNITGQLRKRFVGE